MDKKVALIDGDILVYRSANACQKTFYVYYEKGNEAFGPVARYRYKKDAKMWLNGEEDLYIEVKTEELDPVTYCYYSLNHTIKRILSETKSTVAEVVLSGSENFRKEKYPDYKEGRGEKPKYYKQAREFLMENWDAIETGSIEADDYLGIEQCNSKDETIIVTIDKDLDMIPGWHYNHIKEEMYYVSPDDGLRFFWEQMLMGDNVDNIKAVPNIGPVKAKQLVHMFDYDFKAIEGFVQSVYIYELGDTGLILYTKNKELLWILQEPRDEE